MAKKIKVKKQDWMDGGLESTGNVEQSDIKIAPLSSKTKGKIDSEMKIKKKIYVPRSPRKKGDVTEKAFQYYREKESSGNSEYKKLTDELIKNNPEYKEDLKLKKIRKKR